MLIGVPTEIKSHEKRVGLVPTSVRELVAHGHQVMVQSGTGVGIGVSDQDYQAVGATIAPDAKTVFAKADMIVKIKEPQPDECRMMREGQLLFTYLHLAPDPEQTKLLLESKCVGIAYETVTDARGGLPLLAPASDVAGRMSIQVGAHYLEQVHGGSGILLGGVPGVSSGRVVVLGGGVSGTSAARMAMGLGAHVTILDVSINRLKELDMHFGSRLTTVFSTAATIEHYVSQADLVIGAVLIPGGAAPKLVTRAMLKTMRKGSVLVDVAIDQGGCFETSRPTSHQEPVFVEEGIVHYCVVNMPGAVPRTSSFAINNATLPFVLALANKGYKKAMAEDPHLRNGLNVHYGKVTCYPVAKALSLSYVDPMEALK